MAAPLDAYDPAALPARPLAQKPADPPPFYQSPQLLAGAGAIALLALAVLVIFLRRKRRPGPPEI